MADDSRTDILIVGGGLAGGLAALALADAGLTITLVESEAPAAQLDALFDGRTTALAYGAARVFKRLGLWDALAPDAEPIVDILVTDGRAGSRFDRGGSAPFYLHFDGAELSSDEPLGYIVENRYLRRALSERIASKTGAISRLAPARVARCAFGDDAAVAELEDGRRLAARLVIAADGKASALRLSAGVSARQWGYGQTAIVFAIAHERPHEGIAHELFLPSGPFAILPMTSVEDGAPPGPYRSSIVWSESSASAPAFLALGADDFDREVARRAGDFLGRIRALEPRWSYPLSFHLAERFVARRLALIGDAAHAIHPIAGQGFNLAVKDVAALADVLAEARRLGLDPGDGAALERYERWRRFDSATLAFGTDALNRLFSNDWPLLRAVRGAGLALAGAPRPLRRLFMQHAGAALGRLPALMQAPAGDSSDL